MPEVSKASCLVCGAGLVTMKALKKPARNVVTCGEVFVPRGDFRDRRNLDFKSFGLPVRLITFLQAIIIILSQIRLNDFDKTK